MHKMMAELRRGAEGGAADSAGAARADEVLEATFELQSAQSRARLLETQRDQVPPPHPPSLLLPLPVSLLYTHSLPPYQVQARLEDEAHKLQVRQPLL